MKICSQCTAEYEPKPGQGTLCRTCKNAKQREWRAANREHVREDARRRYAENIEEQRAYQKKYREEKPEVRRAAWRRWYDANREYQTERQRIYREENRERVHELDRERYTRDPHLRARRLIQSRVARGAMPKASECPCVDCGNQAAEYDHYLGYEGSFASMVQPVCKPCHIRRTEASKCRSQITNPS